MTVLVKICGVTRAEDAEAAVAAGADLIGLNFWPRSRRYVTLEAAIAIAAAIPGDVRKVGVFVNAPAPTVLETAARVGLDLVQLHGDEDAAFARALARPYIRAVRDVRPYAVDVAGGVESAPGIKDKGKLRRFIDAAKGLSS